MANVRIIVVEDEIIVAQDIAARLEHAGYEIVAIVDMGEEAVQTLRATPADLVLLDINLLGTMDGIATAQAIASEFAVPIIYLTSLSDSATVERAKATKPAAYMLKPFNDRELQIAIDMAVANFSQGKQADGPEQSPQQTPAPEASFVLNSCVFTIYFLHKALDKESANMALMFNKFFRVNPLTAISSKEALPARSPKPLIVHSTWRAPAFTAARLLATAMPRSS